jgi:hypothetical protein
MKTLLSLFSLLILISGTLIAQQSYDDVVYLKNGSIIRGLIIEQIPNVSLKIQTKDNSVFVYNMEDVEKMTKEPVQENPAEEQNEYYGSEKDPAVAVLLSALIPGVGQYYNGDVTKGVIMNVLYFGGWALYFAAGYSEEWEEDEYYWASYGYYYEEETAWLYVGLGMVTATWIWSMIDAGISASDYNESLRKGKQSYGHMYEDYLNDNVVIGIDLTPTTQGFAGGVTLHF